MRRYIPLLAFLAACGGADTTAPKTVTPLTLAVSTSGTAIGQRTVVNGASAYQCAFTFQAVASGGQVGEFAGWGDGEIDYKLASNGQLSTQFLGPTDFQDWFGSDRVKAGAVVSGGRLLSWAGPFSATVVIRYAIFSFANPLGEAHTANLPLTCQ